MSSADGVALNVQQWVDWALDPWTPVGHLMLCVSTWGGRSGPARVSLAERYWPYEYGDGHGAVGDGLDCSAAYAWMQAALGLSLIHISEPTRPY